MQLEATEQDAGKRLDIFLHERLSQYSRERIKDWVKAGRVLLDGKPGKPSLQLRGREIIDVEPAELTPLKAGPEEIPIDILYEDQDVVAVNKPAGMVVHEGAGVHSGTLVNAMLHHFGTLSALGGEHRPGIVHRLDRFTSGVMLVARTDAAHRNLAEQFQSRQVHKTYLALVHGSLRQDEGRIAKPITRDPVHRTRMTARREEGREALTEYKVLRRYAKFTLLEVRIGTGRTHQIRVHLASMGHPVVGDKLYGAPAQVAAMPPLDRYFLHSWRITFHSPSSGETISLEAPLPAVLGEWLKLLPQPGTLGTGII